MLNRVTYRPPLDQRPEVKTPPRMPSVGPDADIEELAKNLEEMWQDRVPDPHSIIGVTVERSWRPDSEWDGKLNIADGIMDGGGLPKLLFVGDKSFKEQAQEKEINGLSLPGGLDVTPEKYGQTVGPGMVNSRRNPEFDEFQIEAAQYAFETGMPIVGHCRGHQVMNVAGGGTLIQDLPTEHEPPEGYGSKYGTSLNHRPKISRHDDSQRTVEAHLIVIEPGSRLHEVIDTELEAVNSIHHQAVDELSPLMEVVARAPDGVVEASQRKGMPWQHSVQFHPESQRYAEPKYQYIYDHLVDDARAFKDGYLVAEN